MDYNKFEIQVIKKLLSYDNEVFEILNKQFQNSKVKTRKESSAWFYTEILVDKLNTIPIYTNRRIAFWDIICEIQDESFMWFLLYIENWYLTLLEWYTFDKPFLNFDIERYNIKYEQELRKIPKDLLKEIK